MKIFKRIADNKLYVIKQNVNDDGTSNYVAIEVPRSIKAQDLLGKGFIPSDAVQLSDIQLSQFEEISKNDKIISGFIN